LATLVTRRSLRFAALIILVACSGTSNAERGSVAADAECAVGNTLGHFRDTVVVEHAELFSVAYQRDHVVLTVRFPVPDGGPDSWGSERFLLFPCELPISDGARTDGAPIRIPATSVSVSTNEDLGMVLQLGMLDGVRSVGIRAIYSDSVWARFQAGRILHAGGWGGEGPHIETLLDLAPDIILLGSFGGGHLRHTPELRAVGLAAVPTMIRVEPTPLGRAEWIKVMGLLFGRVAEANALFDSVRTDYLAQAARARAVPGKPTVFWATTYAPGAWIAGRNNFQARFLEDAGGVNVLADAGRRQTVDVPPEVIYARGANADVWITENTTMIRDGKLTVAGTLLDSFHAYREGALFHVSKRYRIENGASDYYASGPMRPDVVLRDLISILHPTLLPDHSSAHLAPMERLR